MFVKIEARILIFPGTFFKALVQQCAAGLLLWARRGGQTISIDCCTARRQQARPFFDPYPQQAIRASLQKIWNSHSIPTSTKIRLLKALVWPVATYGCESWTLIKNEETRLDAFEMKRLRKILRFSCTAKKNK